MADPRRAFFGPRLTEMVANEIFGEASNATEQTSNEEAAIRAMSVGFPVLLKAMATQVAKAGLVEYSQGNIDTARNLNDVCSYLLGTAENITIASMEANMEFDLDLGDDIGQS